MADATTKPGGYFTVEECTVMDVLVNSILLKVTIAFRIVAPIIGLFCMIFLLKHSTLHKRLHANAKLLCILHYIWTIGLCFAYITSHGFNFIQLSMSFSNPCEYFISRILSFNLAASVMVFVLLQMTSVIALVIERTIATIRYMQYEKEKNIMVPIVLIVLQIIVAFLIPYVYLMPGTNWSLPAYGPTLITANNLMKNQLFTIVFVATELAVMIYTYILLSLNRCRRRAARKWNSQLGLSTRYQLDENIRALELILPFMRLQFMFNFATGLMVYIFVAVKNDMSVEMYNICERLNGVLTLYPIALLILLLHKDSALAIQFTKSFTFRHESAKVHSTDATSSSKLKDRCTSNVTMQPRFVIQENTDARFSHLKTLFEGPPKKSEK